MGVLKQWLSNNPNSVNAKVVQAAVLLQARQQDQAQKILLDLFERQPDSADVLIAVLEYYKRIGKLEEYIAKLEAERTKHPENRMAVEQLVQIYAQQNRIPEATRVLDATRKAVGEDSDLLYYVGALYARINQRETQEKILLQIVQKDPAYAPASNDLGYTWADRGENLVRAEELIRNAVKSEPDNQSYLDSLGWVLYKRGKFEEARKFLNEAIAPASLPDPVVLDHLGDVLYRLGNRDQAIKQWKRSEQRLKETVSDRDDLKQLKLQLQQKLKQAEANQPVTVAPTVEASNLSPPLK
jgi:tetratricopeptide (TPR) repeat protein